MSKKNKNDAFKEVKSLLEASHTIDDIFHEREMKILFPENKTVEIQKTQIEGPSEEEPCTKEIIVCEGDNDHFYEQLEKELAKLPLRKPFDLRTIKYTKKTLRENKLPHERAAALDIIRKN